MPNRAELMAALKVFRPWLEEEAEQANRTIGESFVPANIDQTTLPQMAELKGMSRAYAETAFMLEGRIAQMPDED